MSTSDPPAQTPEDTEGGASDAGEDASDENPGTSRRSWVIKAIVLVLFVGLATFGYLRFGDALTLENLAEREADLREYQEAAPLVVYGGAFLVYVAITSLSVPGAAALTLAAGWFFGFWQGTLLVSFASTTGATLAFLVSRYLFRDAIESRFGDRLAGFDTALEREGPFYLFTLRLIPAVPFFVINLVMGLTPIRVWTFWWVSQLGMLAGTAVYIYAGASVPSLQQLAERGVGGILSPQVLIAFIILGVFPLAVKKIMGRVRSRRDSAPLDPEDAT